MIKRKSINSSIINSIGYDFENKVLEIEFKKNQEIRQYHKLPKTVWQEFENTDSKGRYFLKCIKNKYDEYRFVQNIN